MQFVEIMDKMDRKHKLSVFKKDEASSSESIDRERGRWQFAQIGHTFENVT